MNFFAHYHFSNRQEDPWFNAGLLFPDLVRIFTPGQRLTSRLLDQVYTEHPGLVEGIRDHIHSDDVFHQWSFFTDSNISLAIRMRESDLGFNRDWFLAHILIELAIDHLLVSQNEKQVEQLYKDLSLCAHDRWFDFFERKGLRDPDKWVSGLSRFVEHRYIFSYKDTGNVVYALNRIYQRAGLGNLNTAQTDFLSLILKDFIPELELRMSELKRILS